MTLKTKSKITIIGAGNVGSHAAVCTVSIGLADVVAYYLIIQIKVRALGKQ